jgi:hypothetical protein
MQVLQKNGNRCVANIVKSTTAKEELSNLGLYLVASLAKSYFIMLQIPDK